MDAASQSLSLDPICENFRQHSASFNFFYNSSTKHKKYRRLHALFMIACYLGVKWCRKGDGRLPK
jgi:hypothetical protein